MASEMVTERQPVGFLKLSADEYLFHTNPAADALDAIAQAQNLEGAVRDLLVEALSLDRAIPPLQSYLMSFALEAATQLRRGAGEQEA